MHRIFKKDQILTIPNLLSVVRLLLIPVIVWLYCVKQHYTAAVGVIILSGLTDVADGIIARKFHMVSDFGKILDPIADKLTQGVIILCLTMQHPLMWALIVLFVAKEICMGLMGLASIKKTDYVNSAKWHGKVNTVVLYGVMILLIFFQGMPDALANALIFLCACMILITFVLYANFYRKLWLEHNAAQQSGIRKKHD